MPEPIRPARIHRLPAESALLAALLLIAIAAGLALVPRGQVARADLLFQSPPTNTPDPNSPLPTPTPTWTPIPTDTPTPLETPTDAPIAPPTDTPVILPTDTPPVVPTDTPIPLPTDTLLPPIDAPPPPIDATAPPMLAPEPILPPPAPPPAPDEPITVPVETLLVIPPATDEPAPAEDQAVARRLDAALFIDNLVIAFGYVWMCFGGLAILGATLAGVLLWRRRSRPPEQAVPAPGAPPAPPPPAPTRVSARHRSTPHDDLD